jgi:hypothetical protein
MSLILTCYKALSIFGIEHLYYHQADQDHTVTVDNQSFKAIVVPPAATVALCFESSFSQVEKFFKVFYNNFQNCTIRVIK